ncbi:Hypothetical_protein [Hexamita inflata]|uniref:Hypothetical_protein n=1 Tax=Hexamita inflata TaxID=28002 RepID=A0AA86PRC7_9EUKA|nr:Hypothetical protein HINF_LOCUS29648 [Hexamita inflata]
MNYQEKLQQLMRLQTLLQELSILESQITNGINTSEEPTISLINSIQKRKTQKSSSQKIDMFADACKQSLQLLNKTVQISDHKQLCNVIDLCITSKNQQKFWTSVQSMIPEKSVTQLREYYQKSFSRIKYEQTISFEDKVILKQLSSQMIESKPSQVVNYFTKQYPKNMYFKRMLVMFIFNCRK